MPSHTDDFDGQDLSDYVGDLTSRELVQVLGLGANNLTVELRATYVPGFDAIDARFLPMCRKMNECQQFLLGILSRLVLEKELDRDLFKARVVELSNDSDIGSSLKRALTSASRVVRSDSNEGLPKFDSELHSGTAAKMDSRYNGEKVFVFTGPRAQFPSGVFSSKERAESWIQAHKLSGTLTAYPIDNGAYEWAIEHGFFDPTKPEHSSPEFIGRFRAAQQEHYHYESGNRESDF